MAMSNIVYHYGDTSGRGDYVNPTSEKFYYYRQIVEPSSQEATGTRQLASYSVSTTGDGAYNQVIWNAANGFVVQENSAYLNFAALQLLLVDLPQLGVWAEISEQDFLDLDELWGTGGL